MSPYERPPFINFARMIVITGAAGFIGSYVAGYLNHLGVDDLLLVDDFSNKDKKYNWENLHYDTRIDRKDFLEWLPHNAGVIEMVIHLGARTDTTEFNWDIFQELNLDYSKTLWNICTEHGLPLIYASSAATYGDGTLGYSDSHDIVPQLQPLNPYGRSKQEFDLWALQQQETPPFWAGLKFFNVYGPGEFHKGRMASVIFHTFKQVMQTGKMGLFRSHNPNYADGGQMRDFIYVEDIAKVILFLYRERPADGLYNLGTGQARTFMDLATTSFKALNKEPDIFFIDTPEDIRDKYQYFTEADMNKLREAGYSEDFTSLEAGIIEYVQEFLLPWYEASEG